jgi:hypothetical protein
MAGKFLKRGAIVDVIRSAERINAIQRRTGLLDRAVRFTTCGCPDPACGGWHTIDLARPRPTAQEYAALIRVDNKARASAKRGTAKAASRLPRHLP